jgi:shikimate dehydrogenase
LLELGSTMGREGNVVLIGLGPAGIATRVLVHRFGSVWTYAGAMGDLGQLTPGELRDQYGFDSLGESTAIYGLTGSPIAHSVSPAMHNAALRAARLDAIYLPFPAADADDFVRFARALGLEGASVTIPFKVSLCERMDDVDPVARRIGAINTIRVVCGRWIGGNSDAAGFLAPLEERGIALSGIRASVLGAGGSARAVAIALASKGADLRVHARSHQRAAEVAAVASGRTGPWPPEPGSWELLVNCTPLGMHPQLDETPVPAAALTGPLVYDLVYNPPMTRLLREASDAGCQTIGGLEMLIAQAQEQFRSWMNTDPPAGVMRAAAARRLTEFASDDHHVV